MRKILTFNPVAQLSYLLTAYKSASRGWNPPQDTIKLWQGQHHSPWDTYVPWQLEILQANGAHETCVRPEAAAFGPPHVRYRTHAARIVVGLNNQSVCQVIWRTNELSRRPRDRRPVHRPDHSPHEQNNPTKRNGQLVTRLRNAEQPGQLTPVEPCACPGALQQVQR